MKFTMCEGDARRSFLPTLRLYSERLAVDHTRAQTQQGEILYLWYC